jgi:hypothetical protein
VTLGKGIAAKRLELGKDRFGNIHRNPVGRSNEQQVAQVDLTAGRIVGVKGGPKIKVSRQVSFCLGSGDDFEGQGGHA